MGTVRALYGHWFFPLRCSCAARLEYERKSIPKICFFVAGFPAHGGLSGESVVVVDGKVEVAEYEAVGSGGDVPADKAFKWLDRGPKCPIHTKRPGLYPITTTPVYKRLC